MTEKEKRRFNQMADADKKLCKEEKKKMRDNNAPRRPIDRMYRRKLAREKLNALKDEWKKQQKTWTLEEDKKILQYLCVKNERNTQVFSSVILGKTDFDELALILGRSSESCRYHWKRFLLPILLTSFHQLPLYMNWEWKNNLDNYIIRNRIQHANELDLDMITQNICPGQTNSSILFYVNGIKRKDRISRVFSSERSDDIPLHKIFASIQRSFSTSPNLKMEYEKRKDDKLKRAQKIIDCYQYLMPQGFLPQIVEKENIKIESFCTV